MRRWLLGAALGALVMAVVAWLVIANLPDWASKVEVQGLDAPLGVAATAAAPKPSPSPRPAWSGASVACGATAVQLRGITAQFTATQLTVTGLGGRPSVVAVQPPAYPGVSSATVIPWPIGPASTAPVQQPLCLARFGTDSRPTVLLGLATGGAHCCDLVRAYPLTASGLGPPVDQDLGNPGASVQTDGDHAIIVTADGAFANQFDAYAGSGMPVRVLEFQHGAFADTTRAHLDLVKADAATWWAQVTNPGPGLAPGIGLGLLAPWVADECVLGQGTQAWAIVTSLQSQHRLAGSAGWPSGAAYVSTLHSFLTQHGYCTP